MTDRWDQEYGHPLFTTLGGGRLIRRIIHRFDTAVEGQPHPKVYLEGGHDTTVIMLLKCLMQRLDNWPPFASCIVMELYQDRKLAISKPEESWFVRALYNNKPMRFPIVNSNAVHKEKNWSASSSFSTTNKSLSQFNTYTTTLIPLNEWKRIFSHLVISDDKFLEACNDIQVYPPMREEDAD